MDVPTRFTSNDNCNSSLLDHACTNILYLKNLFGECVCSNYLFTGQHFLSLVTKYHFIDKTKYKSSTKNFNLESFLIDVLRISFLTLFSGIHLVYLSVFFFGCVAPAGFRRCVDFKLTCYLVKTLMLFFCPLLFYFSFVIRYIWERLIEGPFGPSPLPLRFCVMD